MVFSYMKSDKSHHRLLEDANVSSAGAQPNNASQPHSNNRTWALYEALQQWVDVIHAITRVVQEFRMLLDFCRLLQSTSYPLIIYFDSIYLVASSLGLCPAQRTAW